MSSAAKASSPSSKKSIGKWLLFYTVLFALVISAIFIRKSQGPKWTELKELREAKLVGIATLTYAAAHGQSMPAELALVVPKYLSDPTLLKNEYRYLPIDDLTKPINRKDTIILVEEGEVTRPSRLRIAAFADGSARLLTDSEYRQYMLAQEEKP